MGSYTSVTENTGSSSTTTTSSSLRGKSKTIKTTSISGSTTTTLSLDPETHKWSGVEKFCNRLGSDCIEKQIEYFDPIYNVKQHNDINILKQEVEKEPFSSGRLELLKTFMKAHNHCLVGDEWENQLTFSSDVSEFRKTLIDCLSKK